MKYLPKDTLAYLLQHPALVPTPIMDLTCPQASKVFQQLKTQHSQVHPEASALTFYGMNHLMGVIRKAYGPYEPLPQWAQTAVTEYVNWLSLESRRLLSYIALITTRESRHMYDVSGSWISDFTKEYGKDTWDFHLKTKGSGSEGTVQKFFSNPPACKLERHIGGHVQMFNHGKFSGGYGGKPWGNIAKTLHRALTGETSLEIMVDTAYTLAHNNGPMFNKGLYYTHYEKTYLITILDVQRSGQVPELILSGMFNKYHLPSFVVPSIAAVKQHLGDIGDFVDWYKVEALGSVQKYGEYKKQQKQITTIPGALKKIQIMPGLYATTVGRKEMAAA